MLLIRFNDLLTFSQLESTRIQNCLDTSIEKLYYAANILLYVYIVLMMTGQFQSTSIPSVVLAKASQRS